MIPLDGSVTIEFRFILKPVYFGANSRL